MHKKTVMSRLLSRELSSLLFTGLLQTVVLDKPLKAASDVVGDACGPAVAAGLLLARLLIHRGKTWSRRDVGQRVRRNVQG